jgi:hypothetical protein
MAQVSACAKTTIEGIKMMNMMFQITTRHRAVNTLGVIHGQEVL